MEGRREAIDRVPVSAGKHEPLRDFIMRPNRNAILWHPNVCEGLPADPMLRRRAAERQFPTIQIRRNFPAPITADQARGRKPR